MAGAKTKTRARREPELITRPELIDLMGIDPETFRKQVQRGLAPLPTARSGRVIFYRVADFEHFKRHGHWPPTCKFRGRESGEDVTP